jgi:hypothetical protein
MANIPRGLYRIRGVGGLSNDVHVVDVAMGFPIPEALYRERGYDPPVETLPWKEEYDAAQANKDGNA